MNVVRETNVSDVKSPILHLSLRWVDSCSFLCWLFVCLCVCVCDPEKSNLDYNIKVHKEQPNNTDIYKGTEKHLKLNTGAK